MSDAWGKRLTMSASNFAAFVCWIISAHAETKWVLYTSYSYQGFFGAIAFNCVGKVNNCKYLLVGSVFCLLKEYSLLRLLTNP